MNYILFDDYRWNHLLPLTFTRPVGEIRIGILTIREKWEKHLRSFCSYKTQDHLSLKYSTRLENVNIVINSGVLPDVELTDALGNLKDGEAIYKGEVLIAACLGKDQIDTIQESAKSLKKIEWQKEIFSVTYPWDIFQQNEKALENDFKLITRGRKSASLSKTNNVAKPENIFLEQGAIVEFATLNANAGPIYIGVDAEVMEGSLIRGPFAMGEHSAVKMGAKIYGATTLGPHCKVGGEINNSILFGFSSKAHDGFLGNSVLGQWCNLGADTNNSNLKNNYAPVKAWNYVSNSFMPTGLQFCGLIMGDHSKSGINTMFNTGTVVGVSANIFGSGFPRNFIPCFSWGGAANMDEYPLKKAFETARIVMSRRGLELSEIEKNILQSVFNMTAQYRKY